MSKKINDLTAATIPVSTDSFPFQTVGNVTKRIIFSDLMAPTDGTGSTTFYTGWSANGGEFQLKKSPTGFVFLNLNAVNLTGTGSLSIATLTSGYRPTQVIHGTGTYIRASVSGRCSWYIQTTGDVQVLDIDGVVGLTPLSNDVFYLNTTFSAV